MGINVQVCWEKFANYFDVEMRLVPMEGDRLHLSAEEAVARCDENTIGVVAILGSTFDGSYEPVAEICAALDDLEARTGLDIPVHVDGASGAFVAPFLDPELDWDFRLPRVASINASGHKYGLVYPGRRLDRLARRDGATRGPRSSGSTTSATTCRPSRSTSPGRARRSSRSTTPSSVSASTGYRGAGLRARGRDRAPGRDRGARALRAPDRRRRAPGLRLHPRQGIENFSVFDVSAALRERGWLVPAYTFPANRTDLAALRVVVKQGFSHDLADMLVADLERQLPRLQSQQHAGPRRPAARRASTTE